MTTKIQIMTRMKMMDATKVTSLFSNCCLCSSRYCPLYFSLPSFSTNTKGHKGPKIGFGCISRGFWDFDNLWGVERVSCFVALSLVHDIVLLLFVLYFLIFFFFFSFSYSSSCLELPLLLFVFFFYTLSSSSFTPMRAARAILDSFYGCLCSCGLSVAWPGHLLDPVISWG